MRDINDGHSGPSVFREPRSGEKSMTTLEIILTIALIAVLLGTAYLGLLARHWRKGMSDYGCKYHTLAGATGLTVENRGIRLGYRVTISTGDMLKDVTVKHVSVDFPTETNVTIASAPEGKNIIPFRAIEAQYGY